MDEIKLFLDCIESLLGREEQESGFRGVQSKSLVDLIQLECLSRTSTTLRITNGNLEGRIWIREGDVIDAATGTLTDTAAFREILCWKTGSFEILPADDERKRTIQESYQGLLLESAQAIDEGQYLSQSPTPTDAAGAAPVASPLVALSNVPGIEFLVSVPEDKSKDAESWAAENVPATAAWMRETVEQFRKLGDELQAGQLLSLEFHSQQRHLSCAPGRKSHLLAGWNRNLSADEFRENFKTLTSKWLS